MPDLKISQLNNGDPAQTNDQIPINRAGVNFSLTAGSIAALSPPTNAAGSDTQVQFNDGGTAFGGDAGFTYNKTTDTVTVGGTVSGAYQVSSAAIITEAGTTRTLAAGDNGKVIYFTSGSAVTVTTASGLGAGFSCVLIQGGAGVITVNQGGGTTRVAYASLFSSAGQYATLNIVCPVADTFIVSGQAA